MAPNLKVLRSSITDGIAITPRYREKQLVLLHKSLKVARASLIQALRSTSALTQPEAAVEYLLTLNAIKVFHSACDPRSCNEEEYAIANSKDYPGRRVAYGYTYITPASSGSLYSTVVPIAAAIASGNVVLLQQPSHSNQVASLLRQILSNALSAETFGYVDGDPFETRFRQSSGLAFDGHASAGSVTSHRQIYCPTARVAVVVDRSGDMHLAARDVVQARFAFGGSASYAPDLVLVNEFKVREFCEAVAEVGLRYLSRGKNGTISTNHQKSKPDSELDSALEKFGTTLVSGAGGKAVLLHSRDARLFSQKVTSPTLIILSISSMDDAIDLLNAEETPLLANYVYAAPDAGKYITQFVRSTASFVNHIPPELFVGGPAPNGFAPSIHPRYTAEMFSIPSPTLIHTTMRSQAVIGLISHTDAQKQKHFEAALDASLTPMKEPWGPKIGFFEQGFLFNAALILSGIVAGTICSFKFGYPAIVSILEK